MEMFFIGTAFGIIVAAIFIMSFSYFNVKTGKEETDDIDPESLAAELRAMRVVIGCSAREKEILAKAADYIDKWLYDGCK